MFSLNDDSTANITVINTENDDQTLTLEAFQGDTALIETVNELNHLKHVNTEPKAI